MGTLHVCFLWHMHQPPYGDPLTGAVTMPWVRLHAVKDYSDMALALESVPAARATVNWVPSLLDQIEDIAAPDFAERETFLRLSLAPVESLDAASRATIARHFFALNHERMLEPWPRYAELRARAASGDPLHDEDIRDLQVWFNLAWLGADARSSPVAERLVAKGAGFDDGDKAALAALQRQVAARIIPRWAALGATGRVELTASPAFHPILPLLCDTELARAADPTSPLPQERFRHPGDAAMQVRRALASHAARFGAAPAGMWPSEGAIAAPVVTLLAEAGIRWAATDESLLARALGRAATPAERLAPWTTGELALFFRDHDLSDRIGFVYASWDHARARADFVTRLRALSRELGEADGVVTIALDGENCWESYAGGVMGFLPELYQAVAATPGLRLSTLSEALDAVGTAGRKLPGVPAGSWIDGNLRTWLGDPVKNRAWDELTRARTAAAEPMEVLSKRDPVLCDLLMRAEASDWFWWFGAGHSSLFDDHFDALFRAHLVAIHRRLGLASPPALDLPLDPHAGPRSASDAGCPTARRRPVPTGSRDSFYGWVGAGVVEPGHGAMHRSELTLARLRYLGTPEGLSLRVETTGEAAADLTSSGLRLVQMPPGGSALTLWPASALPPQATAVCGPVLDLFIPASALQEVGGEYRFALELLDARGGVTERLPRDGFAACDPGRLPPSAWLA
ncbi:MAG: glycoside hydrolase [Deltaproteobacteria bacterium]|nr:glycoside hydrolase [Deltaproteobacteria bacterium]